MLKATIVCAVFFSFCAVSSAQNFPDIPNNNRAYGALLEKLTGESYKAASRKEMALALYQYYLELKSYVAKAERVRERPKPEPRGSSFDLNGNGFTKTKRTNKTKECECCK